MSNLNPYNPKLAQLINESEARFRRNPGWRRGQTYFNTLLDLDPVMAEVIRGTYDDPFYSDPRLDNFLARVAILMEES